jgi:uncharacterized membrane protein
MTIAGLPAHPLLVHLAVVLVPIAAVAFVALMWRPAWRQQYGWLIAAMAVAGGVGAFLAAQSGEALEDTLRQVTGTRVKLGDHPDNGDTAEILALLFAATTVAMWSVERWGQRWSLPAWTPRAVYIVGAIAAVGAAATMVIAGDSGARLVWQELGTFVKP